ncbi:MAG: hypothetical protein LQ340_001327 [Diploschistes diacapsis]|nr:MAG: hypothetical protein LQ340_001327 [Diploschistes diacapsis]
MPAYPTVAYTARHASFPYTERDLLRMDETSDTDFYASPRFVTHIDDNAISLLREYYLHSLPQKGRILDFCSSWISHFPQELEERAVASAREEQSEPGNSLEVLGAGMNKRELDANPILKVRILQDLNIDPKLPESVGSIDAATCVVSIDYLTKPLEALSSVHIHLKPGGSVHLVISNRCFPTKAVGRWLRISEDERLEMAGDYLWWSGFRDVEIVTLCDGKGKGSGWFGLQRHDPLWVVRGKKIEAT